MTLLRHVGDNKAGHGYRRVCAAHLQVLVGARSPAICTVGHYHHGRPSVSVDRASTCAGQGTLQPASKPDWGESRFVTAQF